MNGEEGCKRAESSGKYISAIYRHQQMIIATELEPFHIGSGQYIFLITIAEREGITQKGLSEALLIDKTTTAKAVSKLESEGYVRRETSTQDGRCNQLYLTEAGKSVMPRIREKLDMVVALSRQGLSDEEYTMFISLLKRILRNLHDEVHRGG